MAVERQDLVTIGSNIAKYRKLKDYTQKELGDILDVNYKTISKWENGNVAPDITLLKSLADVLDISLDELLSGIKVKHKKNKFVIILNTILCLFIVFLTGVLIYFNNTKYDLYEFKSNHDLFNIEGYIVNGKDESRFVFEDFSYITKTRSEVLIKELKVDFYIGEELIHEASTDINKFISMEKAIESLMIESDISIINNGKKFSDGMIIRIKYLDDNDTYKYDAVELNYDFSKKENYEIAN